MFLNADGIIYDGTTSTEFNLRIAGINTSGEDSGNGGSLFEFTSTSEPLQNRWRKVGNTKYKEPLSFKTSFTHIDFSPFDQYELALIERWLMQEDDYKDLQFVDYNYEDVHFKAKCENIAYKRVSDKIVGFEIEFKCDSPFGYSHTIKKTSDNGQLEILDLSDRIGYIYPDVTIEVNTPCDVTITNSFDGRVFRIKNCVANEVIEIVGQDLQITSSSIIHEKTLYDDFNYIFPRISNSKNRRKNIFTIVGDCTVTMTYKPIRKVGV